MTNFLSLRIEKSQENGLLTLSNAYKPDGSDPERRFVVIEFRSDDEFRELIAAIKDTEVLQPFISTGTKLTADSKKEYCRSLEEDNKKAAKRRRKKGIKPPRTGFLAGKGDEDTLVTYPFAGDADAIDNAARGLMELSLCLQQQVLPPPPDSNEAAAAAADSHDDTGALLESLKPPPAASASLAAAAATSTEPSDGTTTSPRPPPGGFGGGRRIEQRRYFGHPSS